MGMPGSPRNYDIPEIIKWWETEGPGRPKPSPQSPATPEQHRQSRRDELREEIELEKLRLRRLERMKIEGELIPREWIRSLLNDFALRMRGAGHTLNKKFGDDAGRLIHEALDAIAKDVERTFDEIESRVLGTAEMER